MRKALIVSLVLNLLQPLVSVAGAGSLKQVITHGVRVNLIVPIKREWLQSHVRLRLLMN